MKKSEIKTGMKVVPISKSIYGKLNKSVEWKKAEKIGQKYLHVIDSAYCYSKDKKVVMCDVYKNSDTGDYFLPKDLIPYVEVKECMKTTCMSHQSKN